MEFAFGTDPTLSDSGPLDIDSLSHGDPVSRAEAGGGFSLYFVRRKDHNTSGSLRYTACFSDDLTSFTDSMLGQQATSIDADYELVKVPFPAGKRFGCVRVEVYVAP